LCADLCSLWLGLHADHITIGDGGNREGLAAKWNSPQPAWSAFRQASYGHGELEVVNATALHWTWHQVRGGGRGPASTVALSTSRPPALVAALPSRLPAEPGPGAVGCGRAVGRQGRIQRGPGRAQWCPARGRHGYPTAPPRPPLSTASTASSSSLEAWHRELTLVRFCGLKAATLSPIADKAEGPHHAHTEWIPV